MKATNGGTLVLGGTFTGLGNFDSTGGTSQIAGTLDNTGNILALNGVGNSLAFIVGGGIKNGTIAQPANGAVLTFNSGSFLSNVTLATNLTLTNTSLILVNGLTLANSTLSLGNGTNGVVNFLGNQTLSGNGTVLLGTQTIRRHRRCRIRRHRTGGLFVNRGRESRPPFP